MTDADIDVTGWALACGGIERRYLLLARAGREVASSSVVVDLHGSGLSPESHLHITDARAVARRSGTVFVAPAAATPFALVAGAPPGTAWTVPGAPLPGHTGIDPTLPDDIVFIDALIDDLIERHESDPGRIHLRGFSGGARLASHLGAALGDRFASMCSVAGIRTPGIHPRTDRLAVLAIHGRLDYLNPYGGSPFPRWRESVPQAIRHWADRAGCTDEYLGDLGGNAHELRFLRPDGTSPVRLITVDDAGHSWPGTTDPDHIANFGPAGTFHAAMAHQQFVEEIEAGT